MAGELKTETLIVLGVALAAIYLAQKAAEKAAQAAKDIIPYVNPADPKNVVNQGTESFYRWLTGSNGTIGGDLYDYNHKGDPISWDVPKDPETGLTPAYNYTVEQQAADLRATRQLEAGFHGM